MTTTRPLASSANSFSSALRPDLTGRFKSEMLKPKRLFIQLNIILPEVELEGKKKSGFFVCPLLPFVFWMTFSWNIKLRKQENQMKRTLRKIARFRKINIVEHYVFSVSLTGIVNSPQFKRRIRVCIKSKGSYEPTHSCS